MILIAIIIPWFSFFLRGKIISGIVCLLLQITLIGWLPAAIWAIISRSNDNNEERLLQMEKRIIASHNSNYNK